MTPRLGWLAELQASLNRALGGQIRSIEVQNTIDPLKKKVFFKLHEELSSGDYHPLCRLAHGFALANDCILERVHKTQDSLQLDVLLKRRLGPPMRKNPLESSQN